MERYFILLIAVTLAGVITHKKNAEEANFNGVQQLIKNWRRYAIKMPGSTNPRIVFNILRNLPLGEPYFTQ